MGASTIDKLRIIGDNWPQSKQSNTDMYIMYLNQFCGANITLEQKEIMRKNPPETIIRQYRELIHNDPKYGAPDNIQGLKEQKEKEIREKYGSPRGYVEAMQKRLRESE